MMLANFFGVLNSTHCQENVGKNHLMLCIDIVGFLIFFLKSFLKGHLMFCIDIVLRSWSQVDRKVVGSLTCGIAFVFVFKFVFVFVFVFRGEIDRKVFGSLTCGIEKVFQSH